RHDGARGGARRDQRRRRDGAGAAHRAHPALCVVRPLVAARLLRGGRHPARDQPPRGRAPGRAGAGGHRAGAAAMSGAAATRADAPLAWAIAGGGTGGHVTMALALGEEIAAAGDRVLFVGSARGLEARLVPAAGFELVTLPARPFAGMGAAARAGALVAFARATRSALRLLRRRDVRIVISVGGYAAAPAAAAAALLRRPLVLVEPNAVPGRTNRGLARFARRVFTAFAAAEPAFAGRPVETTGAPLRRAVLAAFTDGAARRTPAPPFRLLVVGGSQGARQLNDAMIEALPALADLPLEVFHQTGAADRARVADAYARAGVPAEVVDFDAALATRYQWADA